MHLSEYASVTHTPAKICDGVQLTGVKKKRELKAPEPEPVTAPVLSSRFWKKVTAYARELGMSRTRYLVAAVENYIRLRRGTKVGLEPAERRKIAKAWWQKQPEDERSKRASKAAKARWGKTKK